MGVNSFQIHKSKRVSTEGRQLADVVEILENVAGGTYASASVKDISDSTFELLDRCLTEEGRRALASIDFHYSEGNSAARRYWRLLREQQSQ